MSASGEGVVTVVNRVSVDAAPSQVASAGEARRLRRAFRRLAGSTQTYLTLFLLLLIVVFSVSQPRAFPSLVNARAILTDTSILLVMAVGMTFVMVAAGIDLSVGSVLVFSGVMAAKAMELEGGNSPVTVLLGLITAAVCGIACGAFNGWCITRLRVPPLIATLGSMGAILGLTLVITDGNDVRTVPDLLLTVSASQFLGLPYLVWVAAAVTVLGGLALWATRFGRRTYVIGSNHEAARRVGVAVDSHVMGLYVLSGALAGLAGMMSLTRFATTTIAGHGNDGMQVVTGVVLGGVSLFGGSGTIYGTVVGMLISTVLNNGLIINSVNPFWQQVAIGLVLIIAVYLDQRRRARRDRA